MYDRILVAIDALPDEENRSALMRTEQIGKLTGATVYVLHVARGHIASGGTSSVARGSAYGPRRTMPTAWIARPFSNLSTS